MDDDDDFGADADFLAALAASSGPSSSVTPGRVQQPTPQRIQQPTPQRLDRAPPAPANATVAKVVQPTPQVIASRSGASSILVSPRQKGNPILTNLRSFAWEYSDIPADYVLGLTTCALFLSLKYHRLHPEYIYNRIRLLAGKYKLRVVLTLVDIDNHEDSLKELSKTSLINNVTVILCWTAAEGARYLELYKSFEHANAGAIRGTESKGYTDKMVDFVTVPRSINKTDAVTLVSAFGSIRGAVNARPEDIAIIGGWGEKKIMRWCGVVDEPFRARKAARRGSLSRQETTADGGEDSDGILERAIPLSRVPLREMGSIETRTELSDKVEKTSELPKQFQMWDPDADDDEEDAMFAAAVEESTKMARERKEEQSRKDKELSGGVAAALAKLRNNH
ncbi:putative mating-type switching protein swi10 [Calycina marina]|uniref:Mating-type switching protein swi10 n=1 Tax=Calycina marina TaxID=1763456 RepID=A0A9P8CHW5_9HELO|nr:putative mating-type switching protein swi10 [Calycina marina]